MIHAQAFDFVQRNQYTGQEKLMLFLQRQCESIYDGTKNLQQLSNTVESLGFINKLKENVIDRATDIGTKVEKFAIYSMESGLQEVPFSRILRVKQLEKLNQLV